MSEEQITVGISTEEDSYGDGAGMEDGVFEETVKIVKTRMEHVANAMGYEVEYEDFTPVNYDPDEDSSIVTEKIWYACMECVTDEKFAGYEPQLREACEDAIKAFPFPPQNVPFRNSTEDN